MDFHAGNFLLHSKFSINRYIIVFFFIVSPILISKLYFHAIKTIEWNLTRSFKEDLHVHASVSLTGQEPLQSCHNVNMPNHCVTSYGSDFPHLVVLGGGQVVTQSGFPDLRQCTFHFLSPMMTPLYPRCPQSTK